MTKNGNTLNYRVGQVEKDMESVKVDIKEILTNHLPHIQKEIEQLRSDIKLNSWKIGTIVGISSAVLSIIGNHIVSGL